MLGRDMKDMIKEEHAEEGHAEGGCAEGECTVLNGMEPVGVFIVLGSPLNLG